MKISILTFSKEYNYGANLQCFALCKTLQRLGHQIDIIDIQLSPIPASVITRIMRLPETLSFRKFRKKYFPPFTNKYKKVDELYANAPHSDAFIVGSDQVWNPNVTKRLDPITYFLPFVPSSAKRISYAASIAVSKWDFPEITEIIRKEIQKFDAVSVREKESKEICKEHFNIDAQTVLDPTLLLNDYDEIIGPYKQSRESSNLILFKFAQDSECNKVCLQISKEKNYKPIYLTRRRFEKGFKFCPNASIPDWLNKIRYAKFVVTDSFHCMIFCILFKKQFVVLPSFKERSGRMKDLLATLGIPERFCEDASDFKNRRIQLINNRIDFNLLNSKLNNERMKSLNFLSSALTK